MCEITRPCKTGAEGLQQNTQSCLQLWLSWFPLPGTPYHPEAISPCKAGSCHPGLSSTVTSSEGPPPVSCHSVCCSCWIFLLALDCSLKLSYLLICLLSVFPTTQWVPGGLRRPKSGSLGTQLSVWHTARRRLIHSGVSWPGLGWGGVGGQSPREAWGPVQGHSPELLLWGMGALCGCPSGAWDHPLP